MNENVDVIRNQLAVARTEIKNLRQQISALKHEHQKDVKLLETAFSSLHCSKCNEQATIFLKDGNREQSQEDTISKNYIRIQPIGYVETSFQNKRGVPRQPTVASETRGAVVIDPNVFNNPQHSFCGLEEFSHMWIIFYFHSLESTKVSAKIAPPRLGGEKLGVFATRSPHRPCPIGLSLVKIICIEGNKIYFNGVDMVNRTPVLDLKPYIPQYDSPLLTNVPQLPPVESSSSAIENDDEAIVNLQLKEDNITRYIPNLRNTDGVGASVNPLLHASIDTISVYENQQVGVTTLVSPSLDSPASIDLLDGSDYCQNDTNQEPDSERGDPDGQERFTPPQSTINPIVDAVRIASWIVDPPSQRYDVQFTDDALARLNELIGERSETFKSTLESLLAEDPRSQYVRNRYPDHEYSCVLEDLSISCIFNTTTSICTVIAVRSAEELQS